MRKLQQLAAEATDLGHPNAESGAIFCYGYPTGRWEIAVHVHNEFAFPHCDKRDGAPAIHRTPAGAWGVISEYGDDFDELLDRMTKRVQDAVADTPCEQVPA